MIEIIAADKINIKEFFSSEGIELVEYEKIVDEIIENVRVNKDRALYEYAKKFDDVELGSLVVSEKEWEKGLLDVSEDFLFVLEKAKANIENYHLKQRRSGYQIKRQNGVILGQILGPIEKIGIYVPGGSASYPSSVLMNAIPAKIAGVEKITMVTPPRKDGSIMPEVLAAAKLAGVDQIIKIGGAGAVAALAFGTESVDKVDKIIGPGNIFVAIAKKKVFGLVDIDMVAGPSEILVIADEKANATYIAADLLAQAEHDKLARSFLITPNIDLAQKVKIELESQLESLSRKEIAREAIEKNGAIIIVNSIEEAIEISNEIAPEHLELLLDDPFAMLPKVKNAGSIFLGEFTPESLGDYYAGTNHTLPTAGTAKFSSPLSVDDFIKKSSYLYYPKKALKEDAKDVISFAKKEGLMGHARAVEFRIESLK